jgi:hypothetical protein
VLHKHKDFLEEDHLAYLEEAFLVVVINIHIAIAIANIRHSLEVVVRSFVVVVVSRLHILVSLEALLEVQFMAYLVEVVALLEVDNNLGEDLPVLAVATVAVAATAVATTATAVNLHEEVSLQEEDSGSHLLLPVNHFSLSLLTF